MPKVTIHDISKAADVSIATVSRVLNRKGNVSPKAEAKVWEATHALNYRFPMSGAEQAGTSRFIAVVIPSLSNPFYSDILDGIQDTAAQNQYEMIVSQTKTIYGYGAAAPSFLTRDGVDGLITMAHAKNIHALLAQANPDMPVVQCSEFDDDVDYPYVSIDNYAAAFNAVSYLGSINRRRIALLNSAPGFLYSIKRENGYKDALREMDIETDESLICHLDVIDFNVAFHTGLKLFSGEARPDAVFAVSDVYAIAAIRAATRLNLRVPQDIAVVGFDDIDFAAMNDPPLTTVHQPRYELGCAACNALLRLIRKSPPLSRNLILETELIVRSST